MSPRRVLRGSPHIRSAYCLMLFRSTDLQGPSVQRRQKHVQASLSPHTLELSRGGNALPPAVAAVAAMAWEGVTTPAQSPETQMGSRTWKELARLLWGRSSDPPLHPKACARGPSAVAPGPAPLPRVTGHLLHWLYLPECCQPPPTPHGLQGAQMLEQPCVS